MLQIVNFQFDKGRVSKTIGLRRIFERNMQECGEYKHCKKDKTNSQFLKNQKKTKMETLMKNQNEKME